MERVVIAAAGIGLYVQSFQSSPVQFTYFRPICILCTPLMPFVPFPFPNKICKRSALPSCVLRVSETYLPSCEARGGLVFKALRYKPAGRGFVSRWCHWNFSVT